MNKETDTKELYRITPVIEGKKFEFLSATVKLDFGGLSHTGKVRAINEDHFLITRLGRDQETLLTNLPAGDVPQHFQEWGYAMVVADGMGGAARGEEASRLAISTLAHLGLHFGKWNLRVDDAIAREIMARAERFYPAIRKYWPTLPDGALMPSYSGIRPKIVPPAVATQDFLIQGPGDHGVDGLINLFGIESPGLTSSLAIADHVAEIAG